ncbi:unnamed protein product [Paramecium octaurelia]|uniref:Transmembrane protein n=1 Tax=Paramecium octaurelia TaxID=43137 RepID=A0A8S1T7G9_PAROT|nr:unnamed protein product [Paramecium octaurelia]
MQSQSDCRTSLFQKLKNEFLYHLDIFGQQPSFTILNRSKYPSALGLLTSLMICSLGFYFFLTEVVTMISQTKPAIYQTEISISDTEPFLLYNDNFTLAISIVNRFSEPIIGIDRYFNLNISQCERLREINKDSGKISVNLKCVQLPIEPCNMSHFTTEMQSEYFSIIRMGGIQCINRKYLQGNPLKLQGQVTSRAFRYIFIQFSACHNTSLSQTCASQKEIENILESGHYNIYKSDYLTKLDRPGQPFQEIITNEFTSFSLSTSKTISQRYKIVQTFTDEGLIWEQIQDQQNIQQSEWREISEFYNNQYLIVHYIMLDYKQTNNIRTYVKLQTILGKLGGIFQILIMIVAIILKPIIENFMKLEMVNDLFNFSEALPDTKHQINVTNNLQSNQQLTKRNQNYRLSQSNLEAWLIIFGCRAQKKQQFIFAKNKVNKNLEIVNILRKLQEIKVIKKTLLSKDQYQILKNYRSLIGQKGLLFSKKNLCEIEQNIILQNDQVNLNFNPEQVPSMMSQKSNFQKDFFSSCEQIQDINSLNECDMQEPEPQQLKN